MYIDDYFEYKIEDPRHQGMDHYIVHRLGCHEVLDNANNDAMNVIHKMHACCRVRVEWDIGGLKQNEDGLVGAF